MLSVGIQGEKINQVIIDLFCRPLNGRHFLLINDVSVWTRERRWSRNWLVRSTCVGQFGRWRGRVEGVLVGQHLIMVPA